VVRRLLHSPGGRCAEVDETELEKKALANGVSLSTRERDKERGMTRRRCGRDWVACLAMVEEEQRRGGKEGRVGGVGRWAEHGELGRSAKKKERKKFPFFNFIFKSKFQPNSNSFANFDQTQASQNKYASA